MKFISSEVLNLFGNKDSFNITYKLVIKSIVIISLSIYYLSTIFFGDNSIEILKKLQKRQLNLSDKISKLNRENSDIQKKLFILDTLKSSEK